MPLQEWEETASVQTLYLYLLSQRYFEINRCAVSRWPMWFSIIGDDGTTKPVDVIASISDIHPVEPLSSFSWWRREISYKLRLRSATCSADDTADQTFNARTHMSAVGCWMIIDAEGFLNSGISNFQTPTMIWPLWKRNVTSFQISLTWCIKEEELHIPLPLD